MTCHASLPHGVSMSQAEGLIGTAEAAAILGKSQRTVHRYVKAGRLAVAHTAPGGYVGIWLFNRTDVEALKAEAA